jgi:hypothetical protein
MSVLDLRLVNRIRHKLEAGALPRAHPDKVSGSYGVGDGCSGCSEPMRRTQDVCELDFAGQTYRLHTGCYGLWLGELIRRGLYRPQ